MRTTQVLQKCLEESLNTVHALRAGALTRSLRRHRLTLTDPGPSVARREMMSGTTPGAPNYIPSLAGIVSWARCCASAVFQRLI
jgi:hypothetical protein